jgi:hypothetical protein
VCDDAHAGARTREESPPEPTKIASHDQSENVSSTPVPTRLPADWKPTPELLAWASANCPGIDLDWETEEFVHYWAVEAPAQSPKGPRAKKPAKWERVDWGHSWQARIRAQWLRAGSPKPAKAKAEPGLFDADPLVEQANAVADWWLGACRDAGTAVLETSESKLRALVEQAVAAGATQQQLAKALQACGEVCPAQWKLQSALQPQVPGVALATVGGGGGRMVQDHLYRDVRRSAWASQLGVEQEQPGEEAGPTVGTPAPHRMISGSVAS